MADHVLTEEWRDVRGYEGLYQVSSLGNVKSLKRAFVPEDRLLLLTANPISGYVTVSLNNGIKQRTGKVHIMVCEAFHGPRPEGKQACHKDGDKLNNSKVNLRWGTQQENMNDRDRHGNTRRGEEHPNAKLNMCEVRQIRSRHKRFCKTNGARALAREFGVSDHVIKQVIKGVTYVE